MGCGFDSLGRTSPSEAEVDMNPSEALSDENVLHSNGAAVVAANDVDAALRRRRHRASTRCAA